MSSSINQNHSRGFKRRLVHLLHEETLASAKKLVHAEHHQITSDLETQKSQKSQKCTSEKSNSVYCSSLRKSVQIRYTGMFPVVQVMDISRLFDLPISASEILCIHQRFHGDINNSSTSNNSLFDNQRARKEFSIVELCLWLQKHEIYSSDSCAHVQAIEWILDSLIPSMKSLNN